MSKPRAIYPALFSSEQNSPQLVSSNCRYRASRLVKGRDGLLIGGGDVRKKRVIVSISLKGLVLLIPDGGNEVEHGRGGNGELGRRVPGKCLYSLEVFNKRMTAEADFGDDFDGFRLGLTFLESNGALFSRNFPDAVEVPEEIEMPPAAAVFSVGDGTEAEGPFVWLRVGRFRRLRPGGAPVGLSAPAQSASVPL